MVRYSFSLCSMLSVVLVLPTFSRAPANRVSYSSIDPLTFSRLRTESGLESRPVAPETVLKVLLCTSRLKEEEEEDEEKKKRVKRRWTMTRAERVPTTRNRPPQPPPPLPGWTMELTAESRTVKNILILMRREREYRRNRCAPVIVLAARGGSETSRGGG